MLESATGRRLVAEHLLDKLKKTHSELKWRSAVDFIKAGQSAERLGLI
jgi:hypothetical protein